MVMVDPAGSGLHVRYEDLGEVAVEETKQRLKDTLVALLGGALTFPADHIDTIRRDIAVPGDCAPIYPADLPGSLEFAAFVNALMLRQADWMDSYRRDGVDQAGHPSDQLAAIFALCNLPEMSGRRLIEVTHLSYQLWKAWSDAMPASAERGWDHATKLTLGVPVLTAVFHDADTERVNHALRLSASNGGVLAQVRRGKVTNWKAGASGFLVAQSMWCYRLSAIFTGAEGILGDDVGGWSHNISPIEGEIAGTAPDAVYATMEMKQHPCFQFGQGPVTCGVALHDQVADRVADITEIEIALPPQDYDSATRRGWQQYPKTHSEADHHVAYCVAMGLQEGQLSPLHYEPEYLAAEGTHRLIDATSIIQLGSEDDGVACRIRVRTGDGQKAVHTLPREEMSAGHLPDAERVRRRAGVVERKIATFESIAGCDLGPVVAAIDDVESTDGPSLLARVQAALKDADIGHHSGPRHP